jgi:hypothetical protein
VLLELRRVGEAGGAHAAVAGLTPLTGDPARHHTFFSALEIISP